MTRSINDNKSYYNQLLEDFNVLDYILDYKTDFTKHDRETLDEIGKTGEFLLGIRKSGSTLKNLNNTANRLADAKYKAELDQIIESESSSYLLGSDRFFHGRDGVVKEITRDKVTSIINNFINERIPDVPHIPPVAKLEPLPAEFIVRTKTDEHRLCKCPLDSLTNKDKQVIKLLNDKIRARDSYGIREVQITKPYTHEISWSNGAARWVINPNLLYLGTEQRLDTNQIIVEGIPMEQLKKVICCVDDLSLYRYSTESKGRHPKKDLALINREWAKLQKSSFDYKKLQEKLK